MPKNIIYISEKLTISIFFFYNTVNWQQALTNSNGYFVTKPKFESGF